MNRLIRIGMVVEGPSDLIFFKDALSVFRSRGIEAKIVHANGRPRLIQEARRHLHALRSGRCHRIIFCIDQDVEECAPMAAALLNDVRGEEDVIVCVLARELEAWFLADSEAVYEATRQTFSHQPTDGIVQPKERLKELFRRDRNKYPTEMEIARVWGRLFSFERARVNNRSLERFLGKLLVCME